jgi:hypothetical protein
LEACPGPPRQGFYPAGGRFCTFPGRRGTGSIERRTPLACYSPQRIHLLLNLLRGIKQAV